MPNNPLHDLDPLEHKIVEAIHKKETGFTMLREVKHLIAAEGRIVQQGRTLTSYNRTTIIKLCKIIEKLTKPN